MSGSFPDTAAATESADVAAMQAGIAQTIARVAVSQAQAAQFINAHGAEVSGGHAQVGQVPPSLVGQG